MLHRRLISSHYPKDNRRHAWAGNSQKRIWNSALESCLERFECQRHDEIHFTNPEFVEGIPPFACEFAEQPSINHLLAAADEDGRVVIYNTNTTGPAVQVKDWSAHNNAIFDIAWSSNEPRLVTASGDQSAALWDVNTAKRLATFKQHKCSLKSVSFRPWDGHVFASGARDGSIMIWDDRCKKKGKGSSQLPVMHVSDAHIDQKTIKTQPKRRRKLAPNLPTVNSSYSVSVVLFQKENALLSAGSADGIVKVWDIRKLKTTGATAPAPSHEFPYSGTSNRKRGFSSLALTSTRTRLFASCTDSVVYEYDLSGALDTQPTNRYQGHMNSTFFVKAAISPDDLYLLSGSSDNMAYIWRIGEPNSAPLTLEGHEAEVTSVTWCPTDFTKVVTCSDDNTMRIWKMSSGKENHDDGVSRVVGKARRCPIKPPSESQELGESSRPSQASQSGSESNTSTPKTGESPLSPQLSPMPSSAKKRRFSLKEWVTTSPKTSRPVSPVSSPKRLKSESSDTILDSNPSGETEAVLKRESTSHLDTTMLKVKVNGSEIASAALESSLVPSSKRLKSEGSESIHDSQPDENNDSVLKRKLTAEDADHIIPLKKGKVTDTKAALTRLQSIKCFSITTSASGAVEESERSKDSTSQKSYVNDMPSSPVINEPSSDRNDEIGQDKENFVEKKNQVKADQAEVSHNSPRSPLRDDIPMNRPKCNSSSSSATKRNISSLLQSSSRVSDEKEDGINPEMQQQNLKECFKEKKNGGLVQTKRRSIVGPIDGYFKPIQKKRKSDT